jgi:biotin carboxylase
MQGPAIKIAKELGYYTIVLDGSKQAPCISMADKFEQIDLKDKEDIENFARTEQNKCSRLGIMTAGTDFAASVAWTAEKLGLPGIPYEAALNASDKGRMRECFKNAALPSPNFTTITADDNLETIPLPFPLVIKPVDNMGSRGCRSVDSIDKFPQAAKTAINFSRSGRAIVEAYMDGPEFSVDAIIYHGEITICGLADRHIFFPPYFIEMGHTMPTVIEEEKQNVMLETFCAGIHALGLSGKDNIGAAKGDIKLTENGPMIGEIAARLSGGYMSGWTYPYSSGAQPIKGAILAAMGRKPEGIIPIKKWTCAERAFISIPGIVKEITGLEKAKEQPYVNDVFFRIKEGSKVDFPENNVSKCGNIIATAPDRTDAIKAAETAARSILIKLDPADPETGKFLAETQRTQRTQSYYMISLYYKFKNFFQTKINFNKKKEIIKHQLRDSPRLCGFARVILQTSSFPPDAFLITPELKAEMEKLPEYITPHSSLLTLKITPFPTFTTSTLTDYMGRTVEESLEAVRKLTGLSLPLAGKNTEKNADNMILGHSFWAALIRGGYQGAVYYIENLGINEKNSNRSN